MRNTDLLFESLFKRNFCSVDTKAFLNSLTNEYPFFTAAQFYLLKKTGTESQDFNGQAAKTAILFNNPFWLSFQLNQLNVTDTETEEIIPSTQDEEDSEKGNEEAALTSANVPHIVEPAIMVTGEAHQTENSNAEVEPAMIVTEETYQTENTNAEVAPVMIATEETYQTENTNDENEIDRTVAVQAEPVVEEGNYEEDEEESESEKDAAPLNLKLHFDAAAATKEDTISYQPLYTSDYFASLGIRLNENGKPVDKLGKQLKSFTDWLKVMKKIHPDQLPLQDEKTDTEIQKMAEKSNAKGEVLTEAMADVLIQQGKINKAIEVYQKLSLLNPSKSAYFAAKIDNIER